jgi:hypothetical protein
MTSNRWMLSFRCGIFRIPGWLLLQWDRQDRTLLILIRERKLFFFRLR